MTSTLREAYHKLIGAELKKCTKGKLKDVFLNEEDIKECGISQEIFTSLLEKGFILRYPNKKYRTLLTDIAVRASDIRIKYGGTKYVLETNIEYKKRPVLRNDYVVFDKETDELKKLKTIIAKKIKSTQLTENFLKGLYVAGVKGLSKYQYYSILNILTTSKDVVISAPTAFGKTYAFIIPILIECISRAKESKKGTVATIFYPRKSLGSDQMGKFIRLVYYINQTCKVKLTIGIDDGDVKRRRDLRDGEIFRGIKCPLHPKETLIVKNGKVYCKKGEHYLDFVCLSREDFEKNPPHIVITNIWAYQYRLSNPKYWKNYYLNNAISFFVFDEVHAYRSLVAGIVRYFIKILKNIVSSSSRIILSSATIPHLEEFVEEITGNKMDNMLNMIYNERYFGKDYEKLEVYLLIGINPYTSWETYTHELAIFLSTVNRLRNEKNLQSLIFVDNIKNINRLYSQTLEAIKLGDPKDHLDSSIPPEDPFCYWVYNPEYKIASENLSTSEKIKQLREDIINNIGYHYSQPPDRFETEERIKNGKIDLVFSTSTLELGVDYDNVSVIVNTGIPFTLESIIQRVGRAGRKEDTTLNASLSIIVIRNNPLEYYYLYKGLRSLIEPSYMPKIPISYRNHFVIFYSTMLYITAIFAKNGRNLKGLKSFEEMLAYLDNNLANLKEKLEIEEDITRLKEDIKSLVDILKREDIQEKCQEVSSYINLVWIKKGLEELKKDIKEAYSIIENHLKDIPRRELSQTNFIKRLIDLKEVLLKLETSELHDIKDLLYKVAKAIHDIRDLIRSSHHPLFNYRPELRDLANRAEEYAERMEKLTLYKMSDNKEKYGLYIRACEIYKRLSEKVIQIIESLLGFRFMGNEFIDQEVDVKPELGTGKGEPEFLTNIMVRMPPFELITIPFESTEQREISNKVGARHFWLPKPKNFALLKGPKEIQSSLYENYIAIGKATKLKDIVIPESIEFIDIMSYDKPVLIKLRTKRDFLYIKYGSKPIAISKVEGRYLLKDNIRRLYSLDIESSKFNKIRDATLSVIDKIDKELVRRGNRWGLNFRYVSMCRLGKCVSTDPYDMKCPKEVQEECRLCDGRKQWNPYRKIFPKFYMRAIAKNLPKEKMPLIGDISTRTYEELEEDIEFIYPQAFVYLPIRLSEYVLREIELEPIGYTAKTSYIVLKLNKNILECIINSILMTNRELKELLKYKYFMYTVYKARGSSLEASLMCLKYDSKKVDEEPDKFKDYILSSLIHSITHMFYTYLATEKIGIDPDKIIYLIDDGYIYILENSKNDGMGVVETIKSELLLKNVETILDEFYEWCYQKLKIHDQRIKESESELRKDAQRYLELLKKNKKLGEEINNTMQNLQRLNGKISENIPLKFIDMITYRHIISHELDLSEEEAEYILTIINSQVEPHLCYDGCNECIIFSTGCSEPFAQIYLLSKQLLLRALEILRQKNLSLKQKNVGDLLKKFMAISDEIVIKTPYIDEYGVKLLNELVDKNKKVTLITREKNLGLIQQYSPKFNIKFAHNFHTKFYYFRTKNEELCVHGSINLTQKEFEEREENITITWDKLQIRNIISGDVE